MMKFNHPGGHSQVTVAEAMQVLRIVVNLRFALNCFITGVGKGCESGSKALQIGGFGGGNMVVGHTTLILKLSDPND